MNTPSAGISGQAASAGLTLLRRRSLPYLLRATFSQDMAAPLPASLACEVGGPLTTVQVDGQLSQSGGKLVFPAQTTPVWGDLGVYEIAHSRITGRTLIGEVTPTGTLAEAVIGWSRTASAAITTVDTALYFGPSDFRGLRDGGTFSVIGIPVLATTYHVAVVLRAAGSFVLIKGGIYANWTLLWVTTVDTGATLYALFSSKSQAGTLDNFRVLDLPAPWNADEGIATARIASNSAGDTITHTADGWIEQTLTAATGVDKDLYVRWTDDNNCWIVRQNQAGSTVKLIEKVAGVETSRGSVATTYTNAVAYRHIATCEGSVIKVYVDTTLKITYSSASFQATATTAKGVSAGAELKSYPRTPGMPNV